MIERYVLGLEEIDKTQVALVGGKGAYLGELSRIEGIRVPAGFCVTTDAFRRIMTTVPWIDDQLDRLSRLDPDGREAIRTLSAEIRRTLEGIAIPDDLAAAITRSVARLGGQAAYAVRSSATAEDLPTASFAGQQDTYLNVVGLAAILQHVSRCWASLFTERAVTYRLRSGFDHRKAYMAVVVQQMLFPQAAGILFTADPVTSNRKIVSIEASFGLGEALAAGLANAAFLQHVEDESFLDELPTLAGGREARDAIQAYLDKYGMRCVGEIDITKPRWSERPTTLVPMILGNIKNFEPGAGERRFEQGRQKAWKKEQELLTRLRALPDGDRKAEEAKRMIDRIRTFIGYREYPKYHMISRYFVYKQALLNDAERLVQANVLRDREDIFYLTFGELHGVVRTNQVDDQLIRQRKDAFRSYQALTPPRVLTSDGEVVTGRY